MKSSSICLLHIPGAASKPGEPGTASAEDKLNKGAHVPHKLCLMPGLYECAPGAQSYISHCSHSEAELLWCCSADCAAARELDSGAVR